MERWADRRTAEIERRGSLICDERAGVQDGKCRRISSGSEFSPGGKYSKSVGLHYMQI
jgi:hypothetical protein